MDLINALGDMVDKKEEAKKEKFIETIPTMIQTHLIICKDWADVKDKANLSSTLYKNAIHQPLQCPWLQQAQQYQDYIPT